MRLPIKIYKSFFGTILSIFSLLPMVAGVYVLFACIGSGEIFTIILGVLGFIACVGCYIFLQHLAQNVTENKMTKKWIAEIREKGADADVAASDEFAFKVYNTSPNKVTLKYIEEHNPRAAESIKDYIQQQKKQRKK